jgi:hypothetical protein
MFVRWVKSYAGGTPGTAAHSPTCDERNAAQAAGVAPLFPARSRLLRLPADAITPGRNRRTGELPDAFEPAKSPQTV